MAHPEHNGYVSPFTLKERLLHVKEAQRTLGSQIPWMCDTMDNDLKHALGNAPNSEFIIGPDLKVVRKRTWSNPGQLRTDLEELVGKIEKPTQVSDLKLKRQPPPKVAPRGVVKRPEVPRGLRPLKIEPVIEQDGQPFYAKLRAEADDSLLRGGKGTLYLGFHLDPIYKVHWNNLTAPIKVTLTPPEGVKLSETTLEGPKVKEPADIDPREFVIEVNAGEGKRQPLRLSVFYYACNDEAGWCKPVKQEYRVLLERDRDGGWAHRGRGRGRPARAGRRNIIPAKIVQVDAEGRMITVMTRDRKQHTYKVAEDARLGRGRRRAALEDFQAGEFVRMRIEKAEKGPDVVRGMRSRGRRRR